MYVGWLAVMVGCGTEAVDPEDTGRADEVVMAPMPAQGSWIPVSFLDPSDDCGFADLSVDTASLLPAEYRVRNVDEVNRTFRLVTPDFDLSTGCTVDAAGGFDCDASSGGLPSAFGPDDEITLATAWSGTTAETTMVGDVAIDLSCTAPPAKCDDFAAAGLTFPCTLTGRLELEPEGMR